MPHVSGHSIHGGYTKPKTTQASLPPSMGFQSGNIPEKPPKTTSQGVSVGYGDKKVDPGLLSGVLQVKHGKSKQEADRLSQEAMGSTGVGFGIGSLPPVAATTQTPTPIVVDGDGDGDGDGETKPPKKDPKDEKESWFTPSLMLNVGIAGAKGVEALLDSWFKNPSAEKLRDQNFLAIMKAVFENDPSRKDQFVNDYKDTIAEAFGSPKDKEEAFYQFEDALDAAEPPQGSEAQKRLEPWDYYNRKLYETSGEQEAAMEDYPKFLSAMGLKPLSSRFAQTTGNLEEIASIPLDSIPYDEAGRKFRRQVIEARQILGTEKLRQDQAGQEGGRLWGPGVSAISGIAGISPLPGLVEDTLGDYPEGYGSFLLNPPHPVRPGVPTTPGFPDADGDGIDDRWQAGPGQPFHGVEPVEGPLTAAATTATPFDYSQWPQFTSAYPGHYSNWGPSYAANGGIVNQARPQYDYWNKIANAFPGMR